VSPRGVHARLPFMVTVERLDHRNLATAEQIWYLQHAAYREEAALIGSAGLPPLMETVAGIRGCGETFYGIRDEHGSLIAAISVKTNGDAVTVCRLMVHPAMFRRGLARRLLAHVERECADAARIRVTAAAKNEPAVRLYASMGFVPAQTFSPVPGLSLTEYVKILR